MASFCIYSEFQYSPDNELQKLGVWELPAAAKVTGEEGYWLIYIHGGAWRDPRINHKSVEATITRLLSDCSTPSARSRIAGFASLDYRLSPHPTFPQDPETIPASQLRNARHPDHIRDVRAGLKFLQDKYRFGSRYVLCGHSCGATLGFQLLMGADVLNRDGGATSAEGDKIPLPTAVVGVEGIYDLRGLNARMGDGYRPYFAGPFGQDESVWDTVSPARFSGSFHEKWGAVGKVAVLAYSPDDELIDAPEIDSMEEKLRKDGVNLLAYRDLRGKHDEIWHDGTHMARVLVQTLGELERLETTS